MINKQEIIPSILSEKIPAFFPYELWLKIAQELDTDDIAALNSACGFFSFKSKSKEFKKQWLTLKQNNPSILCAQGYWHTLIYINKTLFVSGNNKRGELGLGHENPQKFFVACKLELKFGERVTQLATGSGSSYLLTNHNRLLTCGYNLYGQLGHGDIKNKNTFTECAINLNTGEFIRLLVGGEFHVLLLTSQNRLLVCGNNDKGELGLGHNNNSSIFVECKLNLNQEEKLINIAAGGYHSLIATNQNRLWVCGSNYYGQLGLGDNIRRYAFTPSSLSLSDESLIEIAAGLFHTVLLTNQNRLFVCGANTFGQLGLSNYKEQLNFVECKPDLGQDEHILTISTNYASSASYFTSNKNRLFVCGDNRHNALGLQNIKNECTFVAIEPVLQNQESIKFVVSGAECIFFVTNQKRIYVCGSNNDGKLGLGDTELQPTFIALTHNRRDNTLIEEAGVESKKRSS